MEIYGFPQYFGNLKILPKTEGDYLVNLGEPGALQYVLEILEKKTTHQVVLARDMNGDEKNVMIELANDLRYHAAIGDERVVLCKLPKSQDDILELLHQNEIHPHVADELARRLWEREEEITLLKKLIAGFDDKMMGEQERHVWKVEVKTITNKTTVDDQQRELKKNLIRVQNSPFSGQTFSGVFVDVGGTLLNFDNTLNEEVLKMAQHYEEECPITVWTDGDLNDTTHKLRSLGIFWKIIPKQLMSNATVAIAIDDDPHVFKDYSINCPKVLSVPHGH